MFIRPCPRERTKTSTEDRRGVEPNSDGPEDAKRASDVPALLARACLPPGAGETERRRAIQQAYNQEHGITPASIIKSIDEVMTSVYERDYVTVAAVAEGETFRTHGELEAHIATLDQQMKAAAANLDFEKAASLRDQIRSLRTRDLGLGPASPQ